MIAYVWLLLIAYNRLNGVWRVELSGVMSAMNLHQPYKANSHFDHTLLYPVFTMHQCWERSNFKKIPTHTQDHGDAKQQEARVCPCTLVDRKRKR